MELFHQDIYNYIMCINTPGSYCVEYSGHILTLTSIGDYMIKSNDNNVQYIAVAGKAMDSKNKTRYILVFSTVQSQQEINGKRFSLHCI